MVTGCRPSKLTTRASEVPNPANRAEYPSTVQDRRDSATKQLRRNEGPEGPCYLGCLRVATLCLRDAEPPGRARGAGSNGNEEDGNPPASGAGDTRFGSGVPDDVATGQTVVNREPWPGGDAPRASQVTYGTWYRGSQLPGLHCPGRRRDWIRSFLRQWNQDRARSVAQ